MEDRHLAYRIYNDDTNDLIANIYVSDSGEYSTELLSKSKDIPVLFGWPIMGSRPNPESKYILAFLQYRVIPSNRDMLGSILEANHIRFIQMPGFKRYLDNQIVLDYLVLNDDRHFSNLGLMVGKTRECKV